MNQDVITKLSKELNIDIKYLENTLQMLSEGSTVAFISRYRKEFTGNLDEEQINDIYKKYKYNLELQERKNTILNSLKEKDLLTPEIEKSILESTKKSDLEAIYEPFKIGKKTKASEAIKLGLEPLAKEIFTNTKIEFNPYKYAEKFITNDVASVEFAIEQALFIISQWISQDPWVRDYVYNQIWNYGKINTKLKPKAIDENSVFKVYYDFTQPIKYIQNYKILAINRAVKKDILAMKFEINETILLNNITNHFFKNKRTVALLKNAVQDSLNRLILPSVKNKIFEDLFARAEKDAIQIFSKNLESILLSPAVKNTKLLAIDPAYVHGCKYALLEGDGTLIKTGVIYPNPPVNKLKESSEIILKEINQHAPQMILIGNGTASWETRDFIEKLLEKNKFNIPVEIVSESGASVYSASELAQEEFPELSVELRSAINIGRRFQDPLNEIIKIDPKSIGIGQYQHDVNQKELGEELDFKIFKTINLVGVNLNSATKHILLHVSGINKKTAQNIVEYRNENGLFKNRNELKKVKGLGAKSFEQSVGFLRIYGSSEFLDSTNIHPESYKVARQIMEYLNYNVQTQKFEKEYQIDELAQKFKISIYDVELIIDSLLNPARDIRDRKSGFKIDYSLKTIDDLAINNSYNGRIENITDFGVFIFVGIKESVFVHNSKITGSFNKNNLFIGQDLLVEILEINKENGRISGLIK